MLRLRTILLAHDLTATASAATTYALRVARKTGATLHVVCADTLYGSPPAQGAHAASGTRAPESDRWLEETLALDTSGVETRYAFVRGLAPAPVLLDYARDNDIDLIVTGTRGRRGVSRVLIGSVAEEIVRHAPCPVLTVRPGATAVASVSRILVPIDFSSHSVRALRHALAVADMFGASLTLLHAVENRLHPAFYGVALQSAYDADPFLDDKSIAQMKKVLAEAGGDEDAAEFVVRAGVAPGVILDVAREHEVDLIVMGTHGLTGMERFFMGSVAEKVLRNAPCPVFTLKSFGKMLVDAPEAPASGASA